MRLEEGSSREAILAVLRAEAERTWGAARAAELAAPLETTAGALQRLAQAPLDLLEEEPDFVGGTPRWTGAEA